MIVLCDFTLNRRRTIVASYVLVRVIVRGARMALVDSHSSATTGGDEFIIRQYYTSARAHTYCTRRLTMIDRRARSGVAGLNPTE